MAAFFFFNDTATTEIYTLSLHDALPICRTERPARGDRLRTAADRRSPDAPVQDRCAGRARSEEHTSELQSRQYLVCRLLLEKKHSHDRRHRTNGWTTDLTHRIVLIS